MAETIDPNTAQAAYEEAVKRIKDVARTQSTHLELYDLPLTELPPEIVSCQSLRFLMLSSEFELSESKCQLHTLPAEITRLSKLEILELNENCLTKLPTRIGQLTRLC